MTLKSLDLPKMPFASEIGVINTSKEDIHITDVLAYLSRVGDVIIEGSIDARHPRDMNMFNIKFKDNNGWDIVGHDFRIFEENVSIIAGVTGKLTANFKARGHKLTCNRGKLSSSDRVTVYKIVTDIDFAGEVRIPGFNEFAVKFKTGPLNDLILFKSNIPEIPRSVGYFKIDSNYDDYLKKFPDIFDNLLLLFEFAASHIINFPLTYISNSQGDEYIEITSYTNDEKRGHSIFYLNYPGELSRLIDSTFNNFVSLRNTLNLYTLIMNYIIMKNMMFVEIAYLQGCVLIGGLTYYFAKNIKNYQIRNSKVLMPNGSEYHINELIEETCEYFSVTNLNESFIKYRDEIINQGGVSSISFENLLEEKIKLETFIEHLILNILKFDGLYWDRTSREWVEYSQSHNNA
jgi:hypothetical protein